ncbi:TetR family transcriptional regulator [Streptomyces sp. P3]|nr:TetR family transcriptional regulator [Streptomyces sp. P3]AVV45808.1 TetR family transcriptional regulator [Streptomyces sp. P3]
MNNAVPARARTRGRPRGNPPTRESIVSAARSLFLEHGYRGTTLRAVAGAVGVDPALIAYHFGSKKGLFADVMQFQCASALAVDDVLGGDPATLPDRLVDAVTDLWEDADFQQLTVQGDEAAEVIREYLERELLARLVEFLGGRDATARATAVVTILGGLIYTRYLNPLPTPAALTPSEIRHSLTPALRAVLAPRPRAAAPTTAGRRGSPTSGKGAVRDTASRPDRPLAAAREADFHAGFDLALR